MRLYAHIYRTYDESSGRHIATIDVTDQVSFSTQLNGGFYSGSFEYTGTLLNAYKYYRDILGGHVVISDHFGRRVYEGKVVDASTTGSTVTFSCLGYYSCSANTVMGTVYGDTATVYDIVKDCVSAVSEWSQTYAFLKTAANFIIGPRDYTEDVKVSDALDDALSMGYSQTNAEAVYFAIWEHRIPYLFPGNSWNSQPNWVVNVGNITGKYTLNQSLSDVFNRVWARYDDTADDNTGPTPIPTPAEDTLSQHLFGVRDGFIDAGKIGLGNAEAVRDSYLERYAFPRQVFTADASGVARRWAGFMDFPYMIRAGDLIVVEGIDPMISLAGGKGVTGQSAYGLTGMVLSTSYDASSNKTSITFGSGDQRFEYNLARMGIGGGLK